MVLNSIRFKTSLTFIRLIFIILLLKVIHQKSHFLHLHDSAEAKTFTLWK